MLATKSHKSSYRAAVMPKTKTKILVCNTGEPSVNPGNRDAREFDDYAPDASPGCSIRNPAFPEPKMQDLFDR
jgi:hypothetical protein